MALTTPTPMGPGFFILFQLYPTDIGGPDRGKITLGELRRDDGEVLEIIQIAMQSGIME